MSNISEVKVGSLIRVKIGKNLILARVLEVLDSGFRVCTGKQSAFGRNLRERAP